MSLYGQFLFYCILHPRECAAMCAALFVFAAFFAGVMLGIAHSMLELRPKRDERGRFRSPRGRV